MLVKDSSATSSVFSSALCRPGTKDKKKIEDEPLRCHSIFPPNVQYC